MPIREAVPADKALGYYPGVRLMAPPPRQAGALPLTMTKPLPTATPQVPAQAQAPP